jgi:hypothetical protein
MLSASLRLCGAASIEAACLYAMVSTLPEENGSPRVGHKLHGALALFLLLKVLFAHFLHIAVQSVNLILVLVNLSLVHVEL